MTASPEILKNIQACIESGLISLPTKKPTRSRTDRSGLESFPCGSLLRKKGSNLARIQYGGVWWLVTSKCDYVQFRQFNQHTTYKIKFKELLVMLLNGPIQVTVEIRQTT